MIVTETSDLFQISLIKGLSTKDNFVNKFLNAFSFVDGFACKTFYGS